MHLRIAAAFLFIVSFSVQAIDFPVTRLSFIDPNPGTTLEEAVASANASVEASVRITFNIPGAGPHKIQVNNTLVITRNMVIDGTSQPGYAGTPVIQISIAFSTSSLGEQVAAISALPTSVFVVNDAVPQPPQPPTSEVTSRAAGFGVVFRGLSITDAPQNGILFNTGDSHVVEACYIGVAPNGATAGNNIGIRTSFQVTGLRVGTDGNGDGDAAEGNVIGNNAYGVYLESSSSNSRIAGNRIGLLSNGTAAGNTFYGVYSFAASRISVLNNIIANNGDTGIYLTSGCLNVVIQGNRIVSNGFSNIVKGNDRSGIYLQDASSTLVGTNGDGINDLAERNIISGNGLRGIFVRGSFFQQIVEGDPTQVRIAGNYIGVDSDGSALGNGTFIPVAPPAVAAARAIGTDPEGAGIHVEGSLYVVIGSDKNGSAGEANEGNVISSNKGSGIVVEGSQQQGFAARGVAQQILLNPYNVKIAANTIGSAPNKVTARPNTLDGIGVESATVEVGGTETGAGNLIANNGRNGVTVVNQGTLATILGNSITANVALGIDLGNDGITANDANQVFPPEGSFPGSVTGDPDFGPNGLTNTPLITSISADRKTVSGTLNSSVDESSILRRAVEGQETVPATSMYRVEFFGNPDTSPNQGQTFLGSTDVTISNLTTCTAAFTATLTTPAVPGTTVTATATRLHNQIPETSEFSVPSASSRVPALLFLSGPTFTPPTPTTDDVVTFNASASIVGITVTWDFGDGSATATGETVTHQYAAPGQYNVIVTLLDAPSGLLITKTLTVPVIAGATPQPPSKPSVSDFRVRTLNIVLDTNPGRDFIGVNGLISLPKGFVIDGTTLDLNFGGVLRSFTFNKKGKARVGSDSVKVSKPKGVRNQDLTVTILLKKGTFAEILKTNATNKDANGLPTSIVVRSRFNGKDFVRVVPVTFKAKGTKSTTKFGVF